MGVNLPTTNPWWTDQRMLDGVELTTEEQKIGEQQYEALKKTVDILNQPVQKGDMKTARARVDELKKLFESLQPEMKEFLYGVLQTDLGKKDLSELFHYKLSSFSRDALLKVLNPDHKIDQVKKETINDAKAKAAKAAKAAEKDLEGLLQMQRLQEQLNRAG
ncbi:hypothetical protein L0244_20085 [bacterium]|nr:hypothetical protein [bacterium]MCI0615298.1 hypothetical protein [bacterium]